MLAWVMNLDFAASDANTPSAAPAKPSTFLMLMAGLLRLV